MPAQKVREHQDLRERRVKRFLLSDGQERIELYSHPQHFKTGGKWIDNSAFALFQSGGKIRSASEELEVSFSKNRIELSLGTLGLCFSVDGLYLDGALLQAPNDVTPVISGESVLYADIFDGVDLRYDITPTSVSENVVFKKNVLSGKLVTGKRIGVRFSEETGKQVPDSYMSSPFARGATNKNFPLRAYQDIEGNLYTKSIDVISLYKSSYPIILDPSYTISTSTLWTMAYCDYAMEANGAPYTWDPYTQSVLTAGPWSYFNTSSGANEVAWKRAVAAFDFSTYSSYTITAATLEINKSTTSSSYPDVAACVSTNYSDWANTGTSLGSNSSSSTGTWLGMSDTSATLTWVNAHKSGSGYVAFWGSSEGVVYSDSPENNFTARVSITASLGGSDITLTKTESAGVTSSATVSIASASTLAVSKTESTGVSSTPTPSVTAAATLTVAKTESTAVTSTPTVSAPVSAVSITGTDTTAVTSSSTQSPSAPSTRAVAETESTGVTSSPTVSIYTDTPDDITLALNETIAFNTSVGVGAPDGNQYWLAGGFEDGYLRVSGQPDWATLESQTVATNEVNTSSLVSAAYYGGATYSAYRAFIPVDLSGISGVTSGQFTLNGPNGNSLTSNLCLLSASPVASSLAVEDWSSIGSTELSPRAPQGTPAGVPVVFTLNEAGIAYLNSHAGGTAWFAVLDERDLDKVAPTTTGLGLYSSSTHGTSEYRPFLILTTTNDTVVLDTADSQIFSTGTPSLLFTGTDSNGYSLEYEIQIDTAATFDSQE